MSRREYFKEENRIKKIAVVFSVVLAMTVVAFALIFNIYNKKLQESARNSLLELGSVNAVVPNQIQAENIILEPASSTQDRGINEVKNEIIAKHEEEKIENTLKDENVVKEEPIVESSEEAPSEQSEEVVDGYIAPELENFEPSFVAPISGEIIKDYAADSLVYSKTLDEWTTHYGIDIRADKMAVIAASEKGTVESIKNDPRYRINYYNITSKWL